MSLSPASAATALALLDAGKARLRARAEQRWIPWTPHPKQQAFLDRPEAEVLFGGAAGPGKSSALLMAALEHVDVPGYSALLIRRTFPDLAQPGGLIPKSYEWLAITAAEYNERDKEWAFPSGAVLRFGYLDKERDIHRYQGGEYQMVGYDELTQFPQEHWYTYLFSRLRRTHGAHDAVPLRMRATSNPGGVGAEWVMRRFGLQEDGTQKVDEARDPETGEVRLFVPAKLGDNPSLNEAEYRKNLARLDSVRRQQLEDGLWVQDSTGLVLPLSNANLISVADLPNVPMRTTLAIDWGSSEVDESLAFAVTSWSPEVPQTTWVRHVEKHSRMLLDDAAAKTRWLQDEYDVDRTVSDEDGLGKGMAVEMRRRKGIPLRAAQKRDRIGFVRLLRDDAREGVVKVVRETCQPLIDEAATLMWNPSKSAEMTGTRHAYDAVLYSWRENRSWAGETPQPDRSQQPGTKEWAKAQRAKHAAKAAGKNRKPYWRP